MKILCSCGNGYDDTFKFCPECAAPNPKMQAKKTAPSTEQPQKKNRFTRVDDNGVATKKPSPAPNNASEIKLIPVQPQKKAPIPEDEDYEDEDEIVEETPEDEDYEDEDYEDESPEEAEYEEEYEDEDELEEDDEEEYTPSFKSSGKALGAPATKNIKSSKQSKPSPTPKTKKPSQVKSSLGKKNTYDPNHDGYYDDRLPAILDEVTKTSHLDVILKIALAIVCIAALIVYCIFYVQV